MLLDPAFQAHFDHSDGLAVLCGAGDRCDRHHRQQGKPEGPHPVPFPSPPGRVAAAVATILENHGQFNARGSVVAAGRSVADALWLEDQAGAEGQAGGKALGEFVGVECEERADLDRAGHVARFVPRHFHARPL